MTKKPLKSFKKDDPRINRNGRPKKGAALTDILNGKLDSIHKAGKTKKEAIADKIIELALNGDITALKYIFDRIDGKPIETVKANVEQNIINADVVQKKLESLLK